MPRVYPKKIDKPKKQETPPIKKSTMGSHHVSQICAEDGIMIGKFRICTNADGTKLQVWKDSKLIHTFK